MILHANTGYSSPYALAVFVALTEKGLPFELKQVDLEAGEHRRPDFAGRSGTVRIPLLEDGDFRLTESSAICEYLDEAYPPPAHAALYPADIRARARARQLQAWVRSDLMPVRAERSTERVFVGEKLPPLSDAARAEADKLYAYADGLITDGDANLFGPWSIADCDLAVMLGRLVLHGDAVPAKLAAYVRRQWRRPSLVAWQQRAGWLST